MSEIELLTPVGPGDKGSDVERVQEWLTLTGFGLKIDGQFGPATEVAVKAYQTSIGQDPGGIVTPALFDLLVAPMKTALAPIAAAGRSLGALTVAYAEQHLQQRPREVGGNNCGPWVRLYMGGNQGDSWPWCAGFTCFCQKQAAQALNLPLPIKASYSCSQLGDRARAAGLLIDGSNVVSRTQLLTPGSFFLVRGSSEEWSHIGIVKTITDETFVTVEGNSNEDGSRDGYEVCSNTRGWTDSAGTPRDFIRFA